MTNVARLRIDTADQEMYLGPAEVVSALPHELELRLPRGGLVRARLALAHSYEPRPGDEVLAIGNGEGHYVIGVLRGTGPVVLSFPGDAEVRAGGVLTLAADRGVELSAPEISVQARKIGMIADQVMNTFTSLRQRVAELFSVHAGQSHTVVEGSAYSQSKSATILTEEKVAINGKEVHLG